MSPPNEHEIILSYISFWNFLFSVIQPLHIRLYLFMFWSLITPVLSARHPKIPLGQSSKERKYYLFTNVHKSSSNICLIDEADKASHKLVTRTLKFSSHISIKTLLHPKQDKDSETGKYKAQTDPHSHTLKYYWLRHLER